MKKIFKTTAIIMMLIMAIFTTGCESQRDKYTKLANEGARIGMEVANNAVNRKYKSQQEGFRELVIRLEPIINEMEKVAKGDKELENLAKEERAELERMKINAGMK